MNSVEKLDSKILTTAGSECMTTADEKSSSGFVSGDLGLTAKVSFRLNSPWKAIGAWIKKLAA